MPIEPAEKRRQEPRFIASVWGFDNCLYIVRGARLQIDRSFVADMCPSRAIALSHSRTRESSATAAANLCLLSHHCTIEARTVPSDNLKQFHG